VMDVGYVLLKEYAGRGVMGSCVQELTRFWETWEGVEEEEKVKTWGAYGTYLFILPSISILSETEGRQGEKEKRDGRGLTFPFSSSSLLPFSISFASAVETNNPGSLKLLTNLGYEIVDVAIVPWPEAKGGGTRESARLERGRFDGKA